MELYKKYRPTNFKDLVGQADAARALADMGKRGEIPHCLLFTGPSGCGKTTIARILRTKLGCSDADFVEINASEDRGIDMVRDIKQRIGLAPLLGKARVWLIDECHAMTSDAQNAFLKFLEDTPSHVYFMLATTDPNKLKKTIITRCTEIRCKEISEADLITLVKTVAEKEEKPVADVVAQRIATVSDGSARKALVLLHAVIGLTEVDQQLAGIDANDTKGQAIEICRALMDTRTKWQQMAEVLQKVDDEPESIRHLVLAWCTSILLKSGNQRAALIIDHFRDNFYDSKKAGLVISCFNVLRDA